jgi:hypothetical protein
LAGNVFLQERRAWAVVSAVKAHFSNIAAALSGRVISTAADPP